MYSIKKLIVSIVISVCFCLLFIPGTISKENENEPPPIGALLMLLLDLECIDADEDSFYAQEGCGTLVDCDDEDPDVYPGAEELCDGEDNDCDELTDEDPPHSNCSFPHVSEAGCDSGECTIVSCSEYWYDVDGIITNGCECKATDEENFGKCDTACDAYDLGIYSKESYIIVQGQLAPAGDEDWYMFAVTGPNCVDCDGINEIIIEIDYSPLGTYFDVYTGQDCNNLTFIGGPDDEATYDCINCTYGDSTNHFWLPCVLYPEKYFVKVYQTEGSPHCNTYNLRCENDDWWQ